MLDICLEKLENYLKTKIIKSKIPNNLENCTKKRKLHEAIKIHEKS